MALFEQQQSDVMDDETKSKGKNVADSTPASAGDPVAVAAAASVLYSWYNYYIEGDKQRGIFVGLWAPTLLAAASYLQQKDLVRKVRQGLSAF